MFSPPSAICGDKWSLLAGPLTLTSTSSLVRQLNSSLSSLQSVRLRRSHTGGSCEDRCKCKCKNADTTATGLDQIPAWFLRLGAPIFAAPLARLFDQSLATGVVPRQWKTAIISPIPRPPRRRRRATSGRFQLRRSCRARLSDSSSGATPVVPDTRLQRPVCV